MTHLKPKDITPQEREIYSYVKSFPGLALGCSVGLSSLEAMSFGYITALSNTGAKAERVFVPEGFVDYVIAKLHGKKALKEPHGIFNAIRLVEKDEKKGLSMYIQLLDEYLVQLGYEPIPESKLKF